MFNFDVKSSSSWPIATCNVLGAVNAVVLRKVLCSVYPMLLELYSRKCVRMNRSTNSLPS